MNKAKINLVTKSAIESNLKQIVYHIADKNTVLDQINVECLVDILNSLSRYREFSSCSHKGFNKFLGGFSLVLRRAIDILSNATPTNKAVENNICRYIEILCEVLPAMTKHLEMEKYPEITNEDTLECRVLVYSEDAKDYVFNPKYNMEETEHGIKI